jgi:hypothetical protein
MKNQPFNVLRHRNWDAAPREPVTIGSLLLTGGTAAGAAATGLALAGYYAVGVVATSLVTSWAMKALAPKPPELSSFGGDTSSRGILVNQKDPLSPHDFVYGQTRKGGAITYYETTGTDNKFLHQIIVLAGHELEEIGDIYLNDEVVTLDGDGFVTTDPYNSKIRIKKHLGSDSQTVDSTLLAESNQITSAFRGQGIAYLYVRYEYDQDAFPNGLPLVTATVKGKKVYDPRTATTAYSNNAALCVRDFITSAYGLSDDQIDDTVFSAAANICDENVSLSGGGTEKKYTINGITRADINYGDVLGDMMTACAGSLFWGAGKWKLTVGDYTAPTKTLTLDDLRGPISLATRVNLRDQFNIVKGTFNDASQRWIVTDYPEVKGATFVTEDGGQETALDLRLPYTTSSATAQRLAKLTLYRGREQMTFTADFGLNAFDVEVGEIIALTNERYGWTEKEFEVVGWSFGAGEAGALTVSLTLRETSEAAFDWTAEEKALIQNNTTLPSPFSTAEVGLSIDAELRVANEQVVGVLIMDASSQSPFTDRFEVQFKRSADTDWIMAGQAAGNRFEAVGISDGLFDVRARSVNVFGARGPWNTITGFYATLFETPPETVTNFAANVVGNTLHLTWTPVGDLDLSHYKVRFSPLTTGASYNNAVDVIKKISRPANSITLPSKTGTYFIKAVDKLGNPSEDAASVVVQTNVADLDNLNFVENLVEHPTFTGAKDTVVLVSDETGPYITLDTSTLFDSVSGDFDDATGLFDGGGGSTVASTGTYQFHDYIDLGAKYVSRVQAAMDVDFLDYANTFDSAAGLFDARSGNFDGDATQFDTISARTQVSFTDDDPAGSPTWSAWQDFFVGDIAARAIRFRAILETSDGNNAPAVRELSVEVDMPDRIEADDDITYTGTQNVTFPSAFKVTPAIGIAASLADGDRYVISGKSRTGFTITTYTGASVSSNPVTFDYVAKGYGKELSA